MPYSALAWCAPTRRSADPRRPSKRQRVLSLPRGCVAYGCAFRHGGGAEPAVARASRYALVEGVLALQDAVTISAVVASRAI